MQGPRPAIRSDTRPEPRPGSLRGAEPRNAGDARPDRQAGAPTAPCRDGGRDAGRDGGRETDRPAAIMVLAPVIGLLLWAGLIALVV